MYIVLMSLLFYAFAEYKVVVRTSQNTNQFQQTIIPKKQERCKAKYLISCTKISSCNNNIQAR